MEGAQEITAIAGEILGLAEKYGHSALGKPELLFAYLERTHPQSGQAVRACVDVLKVPRFTQCMAWLRFSKESSDRLAAYKQYFEQQICSMDISAQSKQQMCTASGALLDGEDRARGM